MPLMKRDTELREQTRRGIMDYISKMNLYEDNKLPNRRNLMKILSVCMSTLTEALVELKAEGIVFSSKNRQVFVNTLLRGIKVDFNVDTNLVKLIKRNGYGANVFFVGCDASYADSEVSRALDIPKNSNTTVLRKIFCADQCLCAYVVDEFKKDLIKESDIETMERYGGTVAQFLNEKTDIKISYSNTEIDSVTDSDIAEISQYSCFFNNKTKYFLHLKSTSYDNLNRPIVCTSEYVDTSRIKYNITRRYIEDDSNK